MSKHPFRIAIETGGTRPFRDPIRSLAGPNSGVRELSGYVRAVISSRCSRRRLIAVPKT
jgi:hypothetical protein